MRAGPGDEEILRRVERLLPAARVAAERWGRLDAPVTVVIHGSNEELTAAAGRPGASWLRAWARPRRIDLQSPRTWTGGRDDDAGLATLLAHELTHCVLFHAAGREGSRSVPPWFQEGMASVAAGERHALADATALGAPSAAVRADPRRFYGTADRAFRELLERHGEARVRALLRRLGEGAPFPAAFLDALGVPVTEFEGDLARRLAAVAAHP
jgi:hypothetical protein